MDVGWLNLAAILMYFFRSATPVTIADFMEVKVKNKIYLLSNGTANQTDAKKQCSSISADLALFDTNQEYSDVCVQLRNFFRENDITVNGVWVDLLVTTAILKRIVQWRNEKFSKNVWSTEDPDGSCKATSRETCCARIEWENTTYQFLKDASCAANTYRYLCIPRNECSNATQNDCSQICIEKNDGYLCGCQGGYRLDSDGRTCRDIDECAQGANPCNQTCSNTNGSFACSCLSGYELAGDGRSCNDVNECLANTSGCEQECNNTLGSYRCSCRVGYSLSSVDRKSCIDVDECNSSDDCQQNCTNTVGSYTCNCFKGYTLAMDLKLCYDIDECNNASYHLCSQVCNNTPGGYECSCRAGYVLSTDNTSCSDEDECQGRHVCQHTCNNTHGSYQCTCPHGYALSQDNKTCEDIDECEFDNDSCDHICTNTNGSHSCSCNASYFLGADDQTCIWFEACDNSSGHLCGCQVGFGVHGDGTTCEGTDECQVAGNCARTCINTEGSFVCGCRPGYRLLADNATCVKGSECRVCQHDCVVTEGSLNCTCYEGYTLHSDMRSCVDVNECAASPCPHICTNTAGSYACTCKQGYASTDNGTRCVNDDESTTQACPGVCINTQGSYYSGECRPGYKNNHGICQDIDECANSDTNNCPQLCRNATGTYNCSDVDATSPTCINTDGSHHCACPVGFYRTPDNSSLCHDLGTCQATLPMCGRNCDNTSWASFCSCHKGFKLERPGNSCNLLHPSLMCPCKCAAGKRHTSNSSLAAVLIKEMILNRKKTSLYRFTKISTPDHRPSSQSIGYSGLIIICLLFGCILCLDILQATLSLVASHKRTGLTAEV